MQVAEGVPVFTRNSVCHDTTVAGTVLEQEMGGDVLNVIIQVHPDAHLVASPDTLTFTLDNWDVPQTVAVTAVDDQMVESVHPGAITHCAISDDIAYHGIAIPHVSAQIQDNDSASVTGYSGIAVDPVTVALEDDDTEQVPGDVDGNGAADSTDLAIISGCYGASPGQTGWNEACDVVSDGRSDIRDLVPAARLPTNLPNPHPPEG